MSKPAEVKPHLRSAVPQFTVPDVVRTAEYYRDTLRPRGADIIEGPVQRVYDSLELVVRDCNGLVIACGEDTSDVTTDEVPPT